MLFRTETWQCDIWPHCVRLRCGDRLLASHDRSAGETLDVALNVVLDALPTARPWRNVLEFHLDTQALLYLVQPWQPGLSTQQELRQLAAHRAAELTRSPAQWRVQFEDCIWQQPALAACLQLDCWQLLYALTRRRRLRFGGVITPFQQLLASWRHNLPETALFVCLSPQHGHVATRRDNAWREAYSLALPPQSVGERLTLIAGLCGMRDCPCYVMETAERRSFITRPPRSDA